MRSGIRAKAISAGAAVPDAADGFPEIDCVRPILTAGQIAAAERRAARLGVGADRALIAAGALSEDDYLRAFAERHGIAFEPLDGVPRAACPVSGERLIDAAAKGLVPLSIDDEPFLVIAPRGNAARNILRLVEDNPELRRRFRFTSAERLTRFVLRYAGKTLAARASQQLARNWPMMSAAPPRWRRRGVWISLAALAILAAAIMMPAATLLAVQLMLSAVFLAWLVLRVSGAFIAGQPVNELPEPDDAALPVYTVIAALYREARSVDGLLRSIERLDYPPEKLDVIIALETDDRETHAAIAARNGRFPITVIPVPAAGPRTKPKALNVALPFARGSFTVIYDAEDRPQPDQLRRALHAFRVGGDDLACVQARLCIDNTADSWLARLFTAEYAGQFDVFLPALATLDLPLPLGGSSNHFRTAILRDVGGWDPYNVTEDADLGMRLARFGFGSRVIDSTTYEEAPAQFGPWLRQRTRWFKGWMQTWLVHMRAPARLLRDLGLPGFIAFQLIVGGNALAALEHPLFLAGIIYYAVVSGGLISTGGNVPISLLTWLYAAIVLFGYLTSVGLGWLGLARRGALMHSWVLVLTPVHWLLLSLAAWRGLFQLVVAPYAWEKTEHGLAKNSRLAVNLTRSLLELERYFRTVKASGKLRVAADQTKGKPLNRPSRPRTAA